MLETILLVAHGLVSVLLVIMILLQRSDGGMGSLGGGGGAGAFMSSQGAGNALTKATSILATLFIVLSLIMAYIHMGAGESESVVDTLAAQEQTVQVKEQTAEPAPQVPVVPQETQ